MQVDLLLDVHVLVVVRGQDDVDHFEGQLAFVETEEMRAVEPGLGRGPDDIADRLGHLADLVARRVVVDTELEDDAACVHAFVVVHHLAQQIGVGTDHLLTAEGADARGLQADVLDGPGYLAEDHEIADFERLVDADRQRGEHIAEHRLHCQCHGDAADAQAGHQRRDIHVQVGQDRQQHHRPHHDQDHNADDGGHHRVVVAAVLAHQQTARPQAHAAIDPQRHLQGQGDEPGMTQRALPAVGQLRQA